MSESGKVNPSEEINENLLKNTAITFSMEGLSKDLDRYIQKKIAFNSRALKYASEIVHSLSSSNSRLLQKEVYNKKAEMNLLLGHLRNEAEIINGLLNFVIQRIIKNEEKLSDDYHTGKRKRGAPKNASE